MEITLKNLQKKVPIPGTKVLRAAKAAFHKLGKRGHFNVSPFSLSVVFVGARRMRAINKKYLGHDYPTDVLTFDLEGSMNRTPTKTKLAEIIICPRVAVAHAKARQTSTENEIVLYVVHGILHLAGFDDHRLKDKKEMQEMERKLLVSLRGAE